MRKPRILEHMRKARERANSGMYHIVLQGNGRPLFEQEDDYAFFVRLLREVFARDFCECLAYCLFPDCAHLVLKEGLRPVGETLKSLSSRYAVVTNEQRAQKGKLFYDRYLSEPLETDDDLLEAAKFVHRLPLGKGGTLDYPHSSYPGYRARRGRISDTLPLLYSDSVLLLIEATESACTRTFLTGEKRTAPTDEQVRARLLQLSRNLSPARAETLDRESLRAMIKDLRDYGASIRQIARLLDVNKTTVEKAAK